MLFLPFIDRLKTFCTASTNLCLIITGLMITFCLNMGDRPTLCKYCTMADSMKVFLETLHE